MDSSYSLADIAAATGGTNRNNDGFGDGGAWWIIILFLFVFCGWGNGNGFGNNGAGGAGLQGLATRADINEGFALNGIENGIRGIQQGICDSTYALRVLMRNEQFYDNLALYATALQMINLLLIVGDVSNNDIMEALQQENKEYMEKIIDQNNRILRILSEKDMSTEQ